MQYRKFGKSAWNASVLGFGCMRFPVLDNDNSKINEPESLKLLEYAVEHGVNYFDTAYVYHQQKSEVFLGKAFNSDLGKSIRIASKLPGGKAEKTEDFDRILNEQLEKLQRESIDFYLLHGLNKDGWQHFLDLGILEWLKKPLADGRIQHIGFSFHDKYDVFKSIVDSYDWDFCQIQYNFIDVNNQAGQLGLNYAASRGLAVVVMEPLLGGLLAKSPAPAPIQALWDGVSGEKRKPAEWALQWLWDQPEVTVVLSGMNSLEQVVENVESGSRAQVSVLTQAEKQLFEEVHKTYQMMRPIPCTRCGYCIPCPTGLDIPDLFEILNSGMMFETIDSKRESYLRWVPENKQADKCIQCRECESKCPQEILISEWMKVVHEVLHEGKEYHPSMKP